MAERATEDRPDNATGYQIHAMYVLPSDGDDYELDLRGSIEIVEQVANYLLKDDAILSEIDPAGMWQMSVRVQWDRVMERLNNARDWCYMPELPEDRQFLAEEGREGQGHPSFYTLEQIAESNKNLKWQLKLIKC